MQYSAGKNKVGGPGGRPSARGAPTARPRRACGMPAARRRHGRASARDGSECRLRVARAARRHAPAPGATAAGPQPRGYGGARSADGIRDWLKEDEADKSFDAADLDGDGYILCTAIDGGGWDGTGAAAPALGAGDADAAARHPR